MNTSIRSSGARRWWQAAALASCIATLSVAGAAHAQKSTAPTGITKSVSSRVQLPVSGTATVGSEQITIVGTIRIDATTVPDLTFRNPPMVILEIEFEDLAGTGLSTKTKFKSRTTIRKTRPLVVTDDLDLTFPVVSTADPDGYRKAQVARANLSLRFDTATGLLTGATGTVTTDNF